MTDPDDVFDLNIQRAANLASTPAPTVVVNPFARPGDYPHTGGPWASEAEAVAALDTILDRCGLFTVLREVPGRIMQLRPDQADRPAVRLDRLLLPGPDAVRGKWTDVIGIEAKAPGTKLGPPLAQMIDYGRAVFRTPAGWVWPSWVFLWHLETLGGPLASMMAQNRLGGARRYGGGIEFHDGSLRVLTIGAAGDFTIGPAVRNGKRTGSR